MCYWYLFHNLRCYQKQLNLTYEEGEVCQYSLFIDNSKSKCIEFIQNSFGSYQKNLCFVFELTTTIELRKLAEHHDFSLSSPGTCHGPGSVTGHLCLTSDSGLFNILPDSWYQRYSLIRIMHDSLLAIKKQLNRNSFNTITSLIKNLDVKFFYSSSE